MKEVRSITVYSYSDLDVDAKQKAYEDFCKYNRYLWFHENEETLKAFCSHFNIECYDWMYDLIKHNFSIKYKENETLEYMCGNKLYGFICKKVDEIKPFKTYFKNGKHVVSKILKNEDINLTGYWLDYVICKPLVDFLKNPDKDKLFKELMNDCLTEFFKECNNDIKSTFSIASFEEHCEVDDLLFFKNGVQYMEDEY